MVLSSHPPRLSSVSVAHEVPPRALIVGALRELAQRTRVERATLTTIVSDGELWIDERFASDAVPAWGVCEPERFSQPLAPFVSAAALRRLVPDPSGRPRAIHGIARRGKLLGVLELSPIRNSGRGPGACLDALASLLDRRVEGLTPAPRAHLVLGPGGPELVAPGLAEILTPSFVEALTRAERRGETRLVLGRTAVSLLPLCCPGGTNRRTLVSLGPTALVALAPSTILSTRQREVAELAAGGATIAQIAASLDTSPETVKSHLKAIYLELGVATRLELRVLLDGG